MNEKIKKYLDQRADLKTRLLVSGSLTGVEQIVAIPALAECEELAATLESLAANPPDERRRTLIIVVVNNRRPPHCSADQIENNRQTLDRLGQIVQSDLPAAVEGLRLAYIDASTGDNAFPENQGVGLARKLGLDHGLDVLRRIAPDSGFLACLDADTRVEPNYLKALRDQFDLPGAWGAVVNFVHRLEGPPDHIAAILCYELFLRYHIIGLRYANSPYAFHSVGSILACTPNAYAAVGGMNRRQAGEDFYFLQELAKTGRVESVRTTTVHPSPRPSRRVPFGTGRRVLRFLEGTNDEYLVYHPATYKIIRAWLEAVQAEPESSAEPMMILAEMIDPALGTYLHTQRFKDVWTKLQQNTPDKRRFLEQFDRWFDALKTLKLVHHLRDNGYPEQDLFESIEILLHETGNDFGGRLSKDLRENADQQEDLLDHLRTIT